MNSFSPLMRLKFTAGHPPLSRRTALMNWEKWRTATVWISEAMGTWSPLTISDHPLAWAWLISATFSMSSTQTSVAGFLCLQRHHFSKIRNVPWISSDVIPGYAFHQGISKDAISTGFCGSHSRIPIFRWMNNPFTIHSAYRFTIHAPLKSRERKHVCFLLTDENPSQPASSSYLDELKPFATKNATSLTMSHQEISAEKAREAAPKSISSSTVGNVSHMDWGWNDEGWLWLIFNVWTGELRN